VAHKPSSGRASRVHLLPEGDDAYLASQGWKVLCFWNNEVFLNHEGVLETILAHAMNKDVEDHYA
jgi:very-short-patch-repair endonuclease